MAQVMRAIESYGTPNMVAICRRHGVSEPTTSGVSLKTSPAASQ